MKNIEKKRVYLFRDLYLDDVEEYTLVYNKYSKKGVSLIDMPTKYILNLVNNERTVSDIIQKAKEKDLSVTSEQIISILLGLEKNDMLHIGRPKRTFSPLRSPSKDLTVWFHITNQCNLRCTYCYVSKTADSMTEKTAERAILRLLQDAKKHNFKCLRINFSGGECLLEFNKIVKLVQFGNKTAKEIGIDIFYSILTNGVLITEKVARFLEKNHFEVGVSLDGIGKYNDVQRVFPDGSGSFRYITRGVEILKHHKIKFNLMVTITALSVKKIPEFTKYCLDHNIAFAFSFYHDNPNSVDPKLVLNEKQLISSLKKAYRVIYERMPDPSMGIINSILNRVSFKKPHIGACGVGENYMALSFDGNVVACPMTMENPLGSVDDGDIVKMIKKKSPLNNELAVVDRAAECLKCQWRLICAGGCPLEYEKAQDKSKPPFCDIYKALIPELLRVEAKRLIKWGMSDKSLRQSFIRK